jgi:hypothetical protein
MAATAIEATREDGNEYLTFVGTGGTSTDETRKVEAQPT